MQRYSTEPRTRNMLKDIDFYYLQENIKYSYWIKDEVLQTLL